MSFRRISCRRIRQHLRSIWDKKQGAAKRNGRLFGKPTLNKGERKSMAKREWCLQFFVCSLNACKNSRNLKLTPHGARELAAPPIMKDNDLGPPI
ncbi:MAG: hypothetical protein K6G15_07965 [Desulfovibrio sp.]|nr:hypothetical protein [Desulfovibrio sp.]